MATDHRGRNQGRHQSRCTRIRPSHWVHQGRHQYVLPPFKGGHGSPHGVVGPKHHLPSGKVAEQKNTPLIPHNIKEFHRSPLRQDVQTLCLHAHSAGSCRQIVPIGTQGISRTLLKGVMEAWYMISVVSAT